MRFYCTLLAFASLLMIGCDSSDSEGIPLALYENEVGEAVVRHLMETVPDPSPGVPKSWSVVLGEVGRNGVFESASQPFLEKFQENGRRVISANVLNQAEPDHMIIDPELRIAAYVLQLRHMSQRSADIWEVEAAWSYKKFYQRIQYEVSQQAGQGKWNVKQISVLEGNWEPEKN